MPLLSISLKVFTISAFIIAGESIAQGVYPDRPVRFIVPFVAGSGADVIARLVGQKVTEMWGHAIVVDNRGGAAGNLGADLVAKSAPDGYTILLGNIATHGINPGLYKKLPYDPIRDFAPVTLLASVPPVLVVHPSIPARSVRELIALAKARPGELNYGSAGIGSGSHLTGELLNSLAKIHLVHVPYKGSGQSLTALLTGEVAIVFTGVLSASPFVKSGRLRALGVSGNKRLAIAPEVPTMAEAGLPGFDVDFWYGVLAPSGTPAAIVTKLNEGFVKVLGNKDTRERLENQGARVYGDTPEQFAAFIRAEIQKWDKVIKSAGIPAN
jgi:tripartite-type tricarboxylate transporter receptor subunit TctC